MRKKEQVYDLGVVAAGGGGAGKCRSLAALAALGVALLAGACTSGDREGVSGATACERACPTVRQILIDDFDVDPARVDCADPMWGGDCDYCVALVRREFEVQAEGACSD